MPPIPVTLIAPALPPEQRALVTTDDNDKAGVGCVTVKDTISVQFLASVIVTV